MLISTVAYSSDEGVPPEPGFKTEETILSNGELTSGLQHNNDTPDEPRRREPTARRFNGRTTRFDTVDLKNVTNLTLEIEGKARIKWHHRKNIEDANLDRHITFGKGWVNVDSAALPELSDDATITVYDLAYRTMPVIYRDGELCDDCEIKQYLGGDLVFDVPHFTNYSTGPNTNLSIWDSAEGGYSNVTDTVTFYANYTNVSSGALVNGASCAISFGDGASASMTEGSNIYNATHAYNTTGTKTWNITCAATGYETLNVSDTVIVNETFLISSCRDLNTSGSHTLTQNISVNGSSCINIGANNVAIDCAGYSLTGNNSNTSTGIYSTKTNTTVRNCIINGFDAGIYFNGASNGTIENNTINVTTNFTDTRPYSSAIIVFNQANNNTISKNVAHSLHGRGIMLQSAGYNSITNSTGHSGEKTGILLDSNSNNNIIRESEGTSDLEYGLQLSQSSNNQIYDSNATAYSAAIYIASFSHNNTVINAIGVSNASQGLGITSSSNNTIINVTGTSSTNYGIAFVTNVFRTTLINSTGSSDSAEGIYLSTNANNNRILDSTGFSNSSYGIRVDASYNNSINNSHGTSNSSPGIFIYTSSNNNITYSSGTSNTSYGIRFASTSNNNIIVNSTFNSSTNYGIYLAQSYNNLFINCSNALNYNGSGQKFYSEGNASANTSSYGNLGWWPLIASNGSDATTQSMTAWYNGSTGGRYANGTANPDNKQWFGNKPDGCIGATQTFTCGETVTESCTLNTNMTSDRTCLTIGSSNIVIDCAAKSIVGNRTANKYGIFSLSSNTTIHNCSISNFDTPVYFVVSSGSRVSNSILSEASFGVAIGTSSGIIISNTTITNVSYGIRLYLNSYNNTIVDNNVSATIGIYFLTNASNNTVFRNTISSSTYGIQITNGTNNLFINNTNNIDYNSSVQKFISDSAQNTSSYGNLGWWPLIASNGSDATTQSMTAWYNGSTGGRYANGTANPNNKQWFGNKPEGCIGATQTFTCGEVVTESCTLNANMTSDRTCLTVVTDNVVIDGAGFTITGNLSSSARGVFSSNINNITVKNLILREWEFGIFIQSGANSSIINNTINSSSILGQGINAGSIGGLVENNTIYLASNVAIYPQGQNSIIRGNRVIGAAVYVTCGNCTIIENDFLSVELGHGAYNNTFANNTIRSISSNTDSIVATGNLFVNNTLTYTAGTIINMKMNSSGNIFCLNNFNATNGYYINDTNGSNSYNCTFDGLNQGNIYPNVVNSNVKVFGSDASSIPGMYIGVAGGGVPYNATTSQGKMAGYATDYAPLTYNQTTGCVGSNRTFVCGENITESCALYNDVVVNGTCFIINTSNVAMDCRGHSITGNGSDYGVWTQNNNQLSNINVNNCVVSGFRYGMYLRAGSTNSTVTNNTVLNNTNSGILALISGIIVRGNHVTAPYGTSGIGTSVTALTITNNTLDGGGYGIYVYNGAYEVIIENNLLNNASIYFATDYGGVGGYTNNTVRNNNISNIAQGIYISSTNGSIFINNILVNSSVYILNSYNHTFINNTNDVEYSGVTQKFTSDSSQNIVSSGNRGWWPKLSSNGSDVGSQANTSWYNGSSGGRNADGSANSSLMYWYNNIPLPYISYATISAVTASSTTITWTTNVNTNSSVAYGLTTALGATTGQNDATTSHSVALRYLTPSSIYYYNITSCTDTCYTVGPYNFTTNGPPTLWNVTLSTLTAKNWSDENIYFNFNVTSNDSSGELAHYETTTSLKKNGQEKLILAMPFSQGDNGTFARNWRGANATVINATYNQTGGVDGTGGYEFGQNISYLMWNSTPVLGSQAFTISVWAKKNSWTQFGSILADYYSGSDSQNIILGYETPNNTIAFYYGGNMSVGSEGVTIGGFTQGEWHHIVAVFDGLAGTATIYLDGNSSSRTTNITRIGTIPASGARVAIGRYANVYNFNGSIDDLKIFNTPLTTAQIRAMYWEKKDVRDGLVVEWNLDTNSTTQEDTSTNNYAGTVVGGPQWTPDGYSRGAYLFNNSVGQTVINDIPDFSGAHATAFWFKANQLNSLYRDLIGTTGSDINRIHLGVTDNSILWYSPAGGSHIDSDIIPTIGRWYHVVASWNGSNATLYVDGAIAGSRTITTSPFNITRLVVGSESEAFNGTIDEVRLYNRSLNATEIGVLYNRSYDKHTIADSMTTPGDTWSACYISSNYEATSNETCSGNITLQNAYQLTLNSASLASLLGQNRSNESAYFTFNVTSTRRETEEAVHYETMTSLTKDGQEQIVLSIPMSYGDNSTFVRNYRGTNGTITGATYNETGGIDRNGGYETDGNDFIYTTMPSQEYNTISWGGWYLFRNNSGEGNYVTTISGPSGNNYRVTAVNYYRSVSSITMSLYNNSWCTATAQYPANTEEWHHIFFVYAVNQSIRTYVDGIEYVSTGNTCAIDRPISGNIVMPISYVPGAGQDNNGLNGSIDDFRIYNTSLTAEQIRQLYWEKKDVRSGLIGEWALDTNESTQSDTSIRNSPAVVVNASYTVGKGGGAYYFNGSAGSITIAKDAQWDLTSGTYTAWVMPSIAPQSGFIFRTDASGLSNGNGNGHFYMQVSNGSTNGVYNYYVPYSAGTWYFLVGQYNSTHVRLVVNGINTSWVTHSLTLPISTSTGNRIGSNGNSLFFNGSIDEVRLYNRTLNDTELSILYNRSYDKHALAATQTQEGDTWSACYISAAGTNTSNEVCSSSVYFPDYTAPAFTITPANNTYLATNTTNLTATTTDEGGLQNITLTVRNSTGSIHYANSSTYTGRNQSADIIRNVTFRDGIYTQVWTSYDNANRTTTVNYTFTIDTTLPNITVNTPENNSPVRTDFIINTTIIEKNLENLTYTWNGTTRTLYDQSLILMLNLDNVSAIGENDTVIKDASRYSNDADCTNCPVWNASGKHGGSYTFNTTTWINAGNNTPDLYMRDFTMSVWVYEYTPRYRATIVGQKQDSGSSLTLGWSLVSDDGFFALYFANGTNYSRANHGLIHSNNTWYHVVGVWNATNRTPTIYVNGVRGVGTVAPQNFTYVNIPYYLGIGSSNGNNAVSTFNGSIDEVRIYNRSLSAAEVDILYHSNLRKHANDSWELIVNQTNVSVDITYNFSVGASDRANNAGTIGTYAVTGSSGPIIQTANNTPTPWDYLDPDTNITITATVTDPQGDFSTVLLQWKNTTSDWNNVTMANTTPHTTSTVFTASFIPGTESNITYRIFANDSTGITGTSANTTIPVFWDCTWQLSSTYLGEAAGYDEIISIGNVTIENTGDALHANNNCTLGMRLTYDLSEGRIYFDSSYIKPSDTYTINAKTNRTVAVNASFLAEIREETLVITVNDLYSRSNLSQSNATATLISTTGGPYLYERISDAPVSVELTPQNISIGAYMRNIMGNGDLNTTAFNVTATWILPAGSTVAGGNTTSQYQNISDNTERTLDINLTLDSSNLQTWIPGTQQYTLDVIGYHENGTPIRHSENRTTLTETTNIVFVCYATSDGVQVQSCGTLDPDNTEETTPPSSGGGGGGGGRGGGGETLALTTEERERIFNTTTTYDLVRGQGDTFIISMENPFPDELIDVRINVTGLLATYLRIEPAYIPSLQPGAKINYTVTITAPAYFDEGDHNLRFAISGALFRQERRGNNTITTISHVVDDRQVLLKILDISTSTAEALLSDAEEILATMKRESLHTKVTEDDIAAIRVAYTNREYGKLKTLLAKIEQRATQAIETRDRSSQLDSRIDWAKTRYIETVQSERALHLAQSAFSRGDYPLALDRIKEAELIYASEVKGEIPLRYYYEKNMREIWTGLVIGVLLVISAVYASKRSLLNHRIKELHKEETVILGLIREAQHECFEKKSMSLEEYNESVQQYERRLAHTITEQIAAENKRQHMLSLEPKDVRLAKERESIMERVKELQHRYISIGGIETRVYEQRMKSLTERIAEIDEQRALDIAQRALRRARFKRVKT